MSIRADIVKEVATGLKCMTWFKKSLSLLPTRHRHNSIAHAFTSAVLMVFSSTLILATFILVVVAAMFEVMGPVFFFIYFKSFPTFLFRFTVGLQFV